MTDKLNLICGLHAVKSVLLSDFENIISIYVDMKRNDHRIQEIIHLAKKNHVQIQHMTRQQLDHIANSKHQGVIAELKVVHHDYDLATVLDAITGPPFLLILDGIQDPHNLGACLRTANAVGVHGVIAPKDRAVGITSVVTKVASGAVGHTPFIQVTNLARTLADLKERGVWLFGASEHATESYDDVDYTGSTAIILGAEGTGLRRLTQEACDFLIKIPMYGNVSSLNVSVAAGICLFEAAKQRRHSKK